MASNQNIDIVIKAIDEASANIKRIENQINNLASTAESASKKTDKSVGGLSNSFGGLGKVMGLIGTAFAALEGTKALFSLTSGVEQSKIAFETLLGSQEKALAMMRDIDEMAAKTPFEKTNLTPLVQQLIGMGFEANKALPIIQVLGDSMAALGRWQDDLNGVVLALGQIQTKGKLSAEELGQMAERGLPVYEILRDKLKLTSKEMENIGANGIKSGAAINALLTGLNERFGGAMEKQSKTLQGQWSNLVDNVKSAVGNAGQGINDKVKGWIWSVNAFFEANRPVIMKFVDDILQIMAAIGESTAVVFWAIWDVVSNVLTGITGQTSESSGDQIKAWQAVFMVIGNGIQGASLLISYVIRGLTGGVKILGAIARTAANTVVGFIAGVIGTMANAIIDNINTVIRGIDKLLTLAGQSATGWQIQSVALAQKSAEFIKESWSSNAEDIGNAWGEMSGGMAADTSRVVGNMVASMERYQSSAADTGKQQSDLGARVKASLDGMAGSLEKVNQAQGNGKAAAKAHNEELKKLKEKAEEAIKPILDKLKENNKEIDDTKKKIKETGDQWRKFKEEGVKALSDVNNEIVKLKKEAADITLKVNADKEKSLGERMVSVNEEIAKLNDQIAEKQAAAQADQTENDTKRLTAEKELSILKQRQAELTDKASASERASLSLSIEKKNAQIEALKAGTDPDIANLQKELLTLTKERDFIQSSTPQKVLDEAAAYGTLSKAQQIVVDAEKEKARQLEENSKKQAAAEEKRMILQAQANQKTTSALAIQTGLKDGMMTASIELEKWKRVEIHDAENIALANDIANKQAAFKTELDTLTQQLAQKLQAQKDNIKSTSDLYREFNQFLKDDTKKTAEEMTATLRGVNIALKETIALRSQAGLTGAPAVTGTPKRAFGGPVTAGQTYQVGERGPEYFIPNQNGTIVPNGQAAGNTTVNINLGGVTVRNDQDIKRLTEAVTEALTRKLQLGKLGIA